MSRSGETVSLRIPVRTGDWEPVTLAPPVGADTVSMSNTELRSLLARARADADEALAITDRCTSCEDANRVVEGYRVWAETVEKAAKDALLALAEDRQAYGAEWSSRTDHALRVLRRTVGK